MANILIVDDEPNILKLLSSCLKLLGHAVYSAGNGREALTVYQENADKIALVLTDLVMPETEVNGLELCRALSGRVPVIIAAAEVRGNERAQAKEAGAVDFMAKPYAPKIVQDKLAEILPKSDK